MVGRGPRRRVPVCRYVTTLIIGGADGDKVVFEEIEDYRVDMQDEVAVYRWVSQQVKWGGIEATKIVQVFRFLARLFKERISDR